MNSISTEYGEVQILYEDCDVIGFVKPAGLLSQKAENSDEASVIEYIDKYLADTGSKAYPVHRLDRTTGGVMIAAKNGKSAAALSALAAGDGMKKEYLAAVHGCAEGGILEDMLYFDRKRNKSFVVKPNKNRKGVKRAQLEYETVSHAHSAAGEVTLVKVRLMTGRTHQIRVQMSNAGHPLLGDGKYGGRDNKCDAALWSHKITFDTDVLTSGYFKGKAFAKALAAEPNMLSAEPSGYPWDLF